MTQDYEPNLRLLTLVDEASKPIIEFYKEHSLDDTYKTEKVRQYVDGSLTNVVRLRLDWEFIVESEEDPYEWQDNGKMIEQMMNFTSHDLAYLVEYGDVEKTNDYLLSAIKGERSRGTEVKGVEILEAVVKREYKSKKNSVEFTMFILFHTIWE